MSQSSDGEFVNTDTQSSEILTTTEPSSSMDFSITMNTPNHNNPATPQVTATTPQEILCTSPIRP